jgi:hypothetical protein
MYDHDRFRKDMKKAGFEVQEYQGRSFWEGPAVAIDKQDYQEVIKATTITLQHDQLGFGLIVYPAAYAPKAD